MITADPDSPLGFWCREVARMKPGECLEVHTRDLRDIQSFNHNGATFNPPDRILGNIVGSAYTHSYDFNPIKGTVTFMRHKNTGERRYKEPDHEVRLARLQEKYATPPTADKPSKGQ